MATPRKRSKPAAPAAVEPLQLGLARQVISPPPGVPLAGYFNPRWNRGINDDLFVRACLFQQGQVTAGIVQFDLLEIPRWLYGKLRQRFNEVRPGLGDTLAITATHTHTGPEMRAARDARHQAALDRIVDQAEAAVRAALWGFVPVELHAVSVVNNPLAYNRRYWMKDGSVITNPGKLNPDIVRPEGPVDRHIQAVVALHDSRVAAVLTAITNHTDTIGDDLVSADWPGFLERALQQALGTQVPVLTLIAPSGNINHFDVTSDQGQTCYAEARRIGEAYAEIILRAMENAEAVPPAALAATHTTLKLRKRAIPAEALRRAEAILAETPADDTVGTSEDLARGAPTVLRWFAQAAVTFARNEAGTVVDFPVMALRLGADTALVTLPGEPFTEIGMAIRKASPFPRTLVVSNANGYAGYIVPDDLAAHGGYEPLPVADGGADTGSAKDLETAALKALRDLAR